MPVNPPADSIGSKAPSPPTIVPDVGLAFPNLAFLFGNKVINRSDSLPLPEVSTEVPINSFQ